MRGVAMVVRLQPDRTRIPVQHLVPQAHRALVRHQRQDPGATDPAVLPAGSRATSSASTKLPNTPTATVMPIRRSTGINASARRPNNQREVRLTNANPGTLAHHAE